MVKEVTRLDANCQLNHSVDALNRVINSWNDINGPVEDKKAVTLKAAHMAETKGAKIEHVTYGLIMAGVAIDSVNVNEMWDQMEFTLEEPYMKFGDFGDLADVTIELPQWVAAYFTAVAGLQEVMDSIEALPGEIQHGIENAPQDLIELPMMEKAKMIKGCMTAGKEMKQICEELKAEMIAFKDGSVALKDMLTGLASKEKRDELSENGGKCKEKKLRGVKECYEFCYGVIPDPSKKEEKKKGEKAESSGCCTTF